MIKKLFKGIILSCSIFLIFCLSAYTQELPIGYINYYSQNAKSVQFMSSLTMCNPDFWNLNTDKSGTVIYTASTDSASPGYFPVNMGIVKDMIFGELITEFEFLPEMTIAEDISGFCFLGPAKTADIYYACIFGIDTISFYYIKNDVHQKIASESLQVKQKSWNHVRVTRDILNRSVTIVLNKDEARKVVFTDPRLVMGFYGFGTINSQCTIRNINIWAPTMITEAFNCAATVNNK